MSTAREQILSGIRKSLGRGPLDETGMAPIRQRLQRHFRHIIPARVNLDAEGLVELFISKATGVSATVEVVADMAAAPQAVARYLIQENLPARLVQAPGLAEMDWSLASTIEVRSGLAEELDEVGLTPALAGVAETGTLLLISGPETPTTLNFVPATHIVLLRRDQIVGAYEDAWDRLRAHTFPTGCQPRAANFITGPLRTGDIEQTIQIGVHGPLRLHIVIVEC
jgi:L-lactate dehydrogenase complex protein LldG